MSNGTKQIIDRLNAMRVKLENLQSESEDIREAIHRIDTGFKTEVINKFYHIMSDVTRQCDIAENSVFLAINKID